MKSKKGERISNSVSIISGLILMVTVVSYFVIIPASVTLHVGDDCDRVNEIGRYGYIKTRFSLRNSGGITSSAFRIGPDNYYILISHNDRIVEMTHFRHERPAQGGYGERHDEKEVESFTVKRPSPSPFFIGIAILGVTGYLLIRSRYTSIVLYSILILFVIVMVFCYSDLADTFAVQPMLVAVGWLAAPILGHSIAHNRKPDIELA